jgi:hypothetical protein
MPKHQLHIAGLSIFLLILFAPLSRPELYVDALEPSSWNGLVFLLDKKAAVQMRVVAENPHPGVVSITTSSIRSTEESIVSDPDEDALYRTERYGKDFSYRFLVPNGEFNVRFHFCEIEEVAPGKRVFHVSIQGQEVIRNLDLARVAGRRKPVVYEFNADVSGGILDVRFWSDKGDAKINAIRVTGKNTDILVDCGSPDDTRQPVSYQRNGLSVWERIVFPGPHESTGSFAELRWGSFGGAVLRWRWRVRPDGIVIAGLSTTKPLTILLEVNAPWTFQASFEISKDQKEVWGSAGATGAGFRMVSSRPAKGAWTWDLKNGNEIRKALIEGEHAVTVALQYEIKPAFPLYLIAGLQDLSNILLPEPAPWKLEKELRLAAGKYEIKRVSSAGIFSGCAQAITQNLFWSRIYHPDFGRPFHVVTRGWCKPEGYVMYCWDSFFNALLSSIESALQARDTLDAIFSLQFPDGMIATTYYLGEEIPRRSQPPVGSLCVWKIYEHSGDRRILSDAYEPLLRWHRWWFAPVEDNRPRRDGNGNGLLEWGSPRGTSEDATHETGMDDSPMYEGVPFSRKTKTMELDDVGLNSLYAIDAEILCRMAEELGRPGSEIALLKEEARVMRERINARLWDSSTGMYLNRLWNGKFSQRKAPTLFYPLLAGVPDQARAEAMLSHLLNTAEFWGEYVLPTISIDDPAFPDQNYWRGKIWGPTNYLVYQGLKRYGFDEVALQFGEKSSRLFLRNWEKDRGCYENFYSDGRGASVRHYTWGSLLCLIGLEELIDSEPWGGLRIGSLLGKEACVSNILMHGVPWEVTVGPEGLVCRREKILLFSTDVPAILRNFREDRDGRVSFEISSRGPVTFTWHASKIAEARSDGERIVAIGDHPFRFTILEGRHRIELFTVLRSVS